MKKFGLVVLGLLALPVAFITAVWAFHDRYFVFVMFIPLAVGYGAFSAFVKAARMGPVWSADWSNPPPGPAATPKTPRPWER